MYRWVLKQRLNASSAGLISDYKQRLPHSTNSSSILSQLLTSHHLHLTYLSQVSRLVDYSQFWLSHASKDVAVMGRYDCWGINTTPPLLSGEYISKWITELMQIMQITSFVCRQRVVVGHWLTGGDAQPQQYMDSPRCFFPSEKLSRPMKCMTAAGAYSWRHACWQCSAACNFCHILWLHVWMTCANCFVISSDLLSFLLRDQWRYCKTRQAYAMSIRASVLRRIYH